ncbi:ABC-2 type transport system permease protein [Marmoricola sp. OAE513]|uniref:ABC transporter permease subunit n=1 Tax=Marmoricola sp. OAE513 TaxID=2817894 RepID=UPI001AE67E4B
MRNLIRVELARYRTRRVILLIVAAATLMTALVAFKTAWDTRPVTATEIATAQARADAEGDRSDIKADIAKCQKDPGAYLDPGASTDLCEETLRAAAKSYLPREPLNLDGTLKGNGIGIALLLVALLIIAGSTFAGADWSSGSIRNQVLFEPRRSRVWAAKAIAVAIGSGAVSLVLLGGFWLSLFLVAASRDVEHGSGVADDIVWHVLRAVLLATGAGVGAFALTTIFRNSVATLSLLFAYSIGGELLTFLSPVSGLTRWSLGNNVFGWLETRLEYFDYGGHCARMGTCEDPIHISHLNAGLYLLVVLGIACAASWASFRRRDI